MSTTTHGTAWLERTSVSTRHVSNILRAALSDLSDGELMDIGTTRSEIDYVASRRGIDPRGIRSWEWLRYLPTVDGQMGPIDFR